MRSLAALGLLAATAVAFAAPAALDAQQHANHARPATMDALLGDIEGVQEKLTSLLEAMPESTFSWRPGDGVRSTGEVAMHIAADNFFLPTPAGVAAPQATGIMAGDYSTVQAYENRSATKAEAIAALRESFTHLRAAMEKADDAFLARKLDVFGSSFSGLELWVMTTTHLHEHLGQLIAYARTNGVVPPWSN